MKKYYTMIGGIDRIDHDTLDAAKQYCDRHCHSAYASGKNLQVIWIDSGDNADIPDSIERALYVQDGDHKGMVRRSAWRDVY
jgi:hypothetical protein